MPGKKPAKKRQAKKGVTVAMTEAQLAELNRIFKGTELTTVVPRQAMGILKQALVARKPPGRPGKKGK